MIRTPIMWHTCYTSQIRYGPRAPLSTRLLRGERHAFRNRVLPHRQFLHSPSVERAWSTHRSSYRACSAHSGIGTHPEDVAHMKRTADPPVRTGSPLVGAGRRSQPLRSPPQAIAPGGNVRVGLEDWLWIGKGQLAADLTSGTEARRVKTVANWRPHYSACAWLWRRPAQHAACCQVVLCQGRPGAGRGFPQML
ncbi:MAG: 3-keto-5-aminohexanoate cleavage protein [Mesorhizobium sp.]|nr:MAG: hypothetical protein EOS73_19005 [Mesorhizobium sp.]RWQ19225.1 MAG: hypothetical protein EOR93_16410 [Mesorhizobium sp.]TIM24794.1 MAG: 3-keto-5-aminohexanoate cleavage protein [Mesorhizobium sp.]